MIIRIRHKGLRVLHEEGDGGEFTPSRARKLAEILLVLDGASDVDDLRARGYRVYRAGPRGAGDWALAVSADRRVLFRFDGTDVTDVDYRPYR